MKYRVTHITHYRYSVPVSHCYNVAHLLPRTTPQQSCRVSELNVSPLPASVNNWDDLYGNRQVSFNIQQPHTELTVTATSEVEVMSYGTLLGNAFPISWEQAVDHLRTSQDANVIDARQYVLESDFIEFSDAIDTYSKDSFTAGRPLVEAVEEFMHRIYKDFEYDPHFSNIATPLEDVLEHRKGVCQDFAHLAIAGLRMHGLAARYVSGYLETLPPAGQERLVGADASHAWFSVFVPDQGWIDFDPTNAQIPAEQHITVAWGRDYADVAPLKGVLFGGGDKHKLEVSVDVQRL